MKKNLVILMLVCLASVARGQTDTLIQKKAITTKSTQATQKWYDNISIRGYMQMRYNRLLETNENLGCEQCDKSWGKDGGFFIRRMRVILFGQVAKNVYLYIQPDFASSPTSDKLNFVQIRDAYFDIGLDSNNEFRFRIGQSKIPFGFENLQSSQNRLPLDRADALNSAISNERDLGLMLYWAPKEKRKLFANLVKDGLKGSGDYGIIGIGIYNGQTANSPEQNEKQHVVARVTYPFTIKNQVVEASLQAYKGKYVLSKSNLTEKVKYSADRNYIDERIAGTFVLYPKPIGILAEYNVGRGPEFNKVTDSIEVKPLKGGFITLSYQARLNNQILIPFTRYQYYDGGKKHEKDARSYNVNDLELGVEWQPMRNFELAAMYTISKRRYEDFTLKENLQTGSLLRLQAQVNF